MPVQRESSSKRFLRVLDSVPPAVQRTIIDKALLPLLDTLPKSEAYEAIKQAQRVAKKYSTLPQMDLSAKKVEVNSLLDELAKDVKCCHAQDHLTYEIMLREVIESIADWLNDLWITAYEYKIDFTRAHSCLLFSLGVLDHVQGMKGGGCRCMFSTIYVPVTIKSRSGEVIKEFTNMGISNVESAILWVWRDVFLALLSSKNPSFLKLVPDLLTDIDDVIGWSGLERLLLGGTSFEDSVRQPRCNGHVPDGDSDDQDLNDQDEIFYADHWNYKLNKQVPKLRKLVQDRMINIFEAAPESQLYKTLDSLAVDDKSKEDLKKLLSSVATTSASSMVAALKIYTNENNHDGVAELLDDHALLLRPRDYEVVQNAVRSISYSEKHHERAMRFTEMELLDTARTLKRGLLRSFAKMDTPALRAEVAQILKLRAGSAVRQGRAEHWVEGAATPGTAANPMAFAAVMMGLPVPVQLQGLADEAEQMGFIDLDPHDPDFAELREEHRPDIKARFEGWTDTAEQLESGAALLERVYKEMVKLMPWLQAPDLVEEMIGRISDKPSKHHLCDALEAVSAFSEAQKVKARRRRSVPCPTVDDDDDDEPPPLEPINAPFFPVPETIEDLD